MIELNPPIVYVVDDDQSVRRALRRLLRSRGFEVESFASAEDFLSLDPATDRPGCLLLDLQMPGVSGFELQERLAATGRTIPIVYLSGHGTVPISVRAMKRGAVDFLTKPFDAQHLLSAVETALERDREAGTKRARTSAIQQRIGSLTPRQRQVLRLVMQGLLNKQIAYHLGTSEKTVKVHRARGMQKMGVRSVAELVRLSEEFETAQAQTPAT